MTAPRTPLAAGWVIIAVPLAATVLPLLFGASWVTHVMLLCALVPAVVVLHLFIRSDLFPEPPRIVLVTFAFGVLGIVPVVCIAPVLLRVFGGLFAIFGPLAEPLSKAFVGAAVPEETVKFLILTVYCARHSAFDEPMDGLVYGVAASLGFAALENVGYVFKDPTYPTWLRTAILRALFAVPAHAVDGAVMGFFIGLRHALPARRAQLTRAAWVVPVVLHGLYDLGCLIGTGALWFNVFVFELAIAVRMLRKLEAIQQAREQPEAVVQAVWRAARRQLGLKPRDLR